MLTLEHQENPNHVPLKKGSAPPRYVAWIPLIQQTRSASTKLDNHRGFTSSEFPKVNSDSAVSFNFSFQENSTETRSVDNLDVKLDRKI